MSPTSGYRAATEERADREPGGKGRLQEWFRCSHFQSREKSLTEQSAEPDELNARISVAVCGRDGRLIAFSRMDGCAGWDVDRSSLGVATAAAITGCPSEQLSERYTSGLRISSHANVVSPRGQRGGLPIVEEGVIEGGCGVSGAATAEESEVCTRAGIAALNSARTEQALSQAKANPSMVSAPKCRQGFSGVDTDGRAQTTSRTHAASARRRRSSGAKVVALRASLEATRSVPDHQKSKRRLTSRQSLSRHAAQPHPATPQVQGGRPCSPAPT